MSEKPREHPNPDEDATLEAILAEYKGTAFLAGQKKMSKEELDQKTEQILKETLGEPSEETPKESPLVSPRAVQMPVGEPTIALPIVPLADIAAAMEAAEPAVQRPAVESVKPPEPSPIIAPESPPVEHSVSPNVSHPTSQVVTEQVTPRRQRLESEKVITLPFAGRPKSKWDLEPEIEQDSFTDDEDEHYADRAKIEEFAARLEETEAHMAEDDEDDDEEEKGGMFARFGRGRREKIKEHEEEPDTPGDEGRYDDADMEEDGLSPLQAAGRYGRGLGGYQLRGMGTILLALFMLLFTGLGDAGWNLPGFLGTFRGLTATLLVMQLLAMFLCGEVITTGLFDIFRRRPGVETLVTVAALAAIADAVWILQTEISGRGLPYATVVAAALGTALLGIKSTRNAMKITLRAAATGSSPYVVTSRYEKSDGSFTLFKTRSDSEGFVRKTEQIDYSEHIYTTAAPLLLVASAVFALLVAFAMGEMSNAIRYFSAMTVVSASFSGLLAYGLPYAMLSRKLAKVGAALAGWGGAAEVTAAESVVITDKDVFPAGTTSLSGVKIFLSPAAERERVIAYTASLVIASDMGLSDLFEDILQRENLGILRVEDMACYEGGGFKGKVGSEEVIVGSAGLMNLMGIRLPQNLNVKNAVFTVMGGELAGVFAINYAPQASVMNALVSLLQTKVKPLFAVRDFNITPRMLQNKFHISTDKIDFLTYEERYTLSDLKPDERARPFAVLNREGLRPFVDVLIGGKRLRRVVIRNTILSLASSVIGLLLLLSFFWVGAAETASAVNLFYYMGAWLFVMCLLSRAVNLD